jgi:hypothetical protein
MHLSFQRNFANAAKIIRATIERRCSPGLDRNAREKLRHPCTASKLFESLAEIQRKEADIVVQTHRALEKPERIVTPAQFLDTVTTHSEK